MILYNFSEFKLKNIDTSRATTKQYYKIVIFYKFLSNKTDIFRELLPNNTEIFHRRCTINYLSHSHMWTYSKSLLTGIIAKSTFRKVFGFKILKLYYWDIYYFCYDYKHLPFSNKLWQPEINFPSRPSNVMPRTVAKSSLTKSSSLNFWTVAQKQGSQKIY